MIIINILLQLILININNRKIMEILLLYSIFLSINTLDIENISKGVGLYNGLYMEDTLSKIIEIIIYIVCIIVIKYVSRNELLITIIIVGMITIINSNDLIGLLLGIEIETLGIYILIGKESKRKNSIGIKYYILGAITSSIIYLGISIIYGIIGVTSIEEIRIIKEINKDLNIPIYIIIYGLIFKLGGVPLHNYLSDIIEGIKLNISIWILGISKITILIIIYKINILESGISEILLIVIQLSLIIGALVGTIQKRLKRLITYSSINNIGYLLLGALININMIKVGWILYIIQYILTTINILIIIICLKGKNKAGAPLEEIKELKVLEENSVRLVFLITLLSLMGIPPLLGFYGKLYLIIPILESGQINIVILIIISNIISSIYYIKLIKLIYNFSNEESFELSRGVNKGTRRVNTGIALNKLSTQSLTKVSINNYDNRLGIITISLIMLPTKEIYTILLTI